VERENFAPEIYEGYALWTSEPEGEVNLVGWRGQAAGNLDHRCVRNPR